ncbi:MAG: hypothetical protein ACSHW0_16510 [Thalassotalea sp.]
MKYFQYHWQSRLLIALLVSCTISALLLTLALTSWAVQINQLGYSHGENDGERAIPAVLMYILPFVKELILIGMPLLLTLLWLKYLIKSKAFLSLKQKSRC